MKKISSILLGVMGIAALTAAGAMADGPGWGGGHDGHGGWDHDRDHDGRGRFDRDHLPIFIPRDRAPGYQPRYGFPGNPGSTCERKTNGQYICVGDTVIGTSSGNLYTVQMLFM